MRGGGQSYIDFPTSAVEPRDWEKFFADVKTRHSHSGPVWKFTVNSIGTERSQTAEIGRRRKQSYNIRAQKLGTKQSNRLFAWHPRFGFPAPPDPTKRAAAPNLVIYLIRTTDGEFWAGWFQAAVPYGTWPVDRQLETMFRNNDGCIYLDPAISFEESDGRWPFLAAVVVVPAEPVVQTSGAAPAGRRPPRYRQRSEQRVIEELFSNDFPPHPTKEKLRVTRNVLRRNEKAVGALKELYGGECQLTGQKYVFKKMDGRFYCEAHHLYPLGEGGADSPRNLIIVSPLIHRMFHYAQVTGLDLSKIVDNKLEIKMNGEPFTITWHPKHAELVAGAGTKKDE